MALQDFNGPFTRRRLINELQDLQTMFTDGSAGRQLMGELLEDTVADSLPNNTDADVYVVSGGRIFVFGYWLEVTTAIQAQATAIKLRWKPSGGSYGDLSSTVDAISAAVGSTINLTSSAISIGASILIGHNQLGFTNAAQGLVFPAGTIGFHSATNSTGEVKGRLLWAPLDAAGTVALA